MYRAILEPNSSNCCRDMVHRQCCMPGCCSQRRLCACQMAALETSRAPANEVSVLCRAVRQTAEAENNITSVERILDYTMLASEPPRVAEGASSVPVEHLAGPDHAKPCLRS